MYCAKVRVGVFAGCTRADYDMDAISHIQAAMILLQLTSLMFGVLYGAWWFREEKIRQRMAGTVIMVIGVFLIGWFI